MMARQVNLSLSNIGYRGPIRRPVNQTEVRTLTWTVALSTAAGTTLNGFIEDQPFTSATEFASYAARWLEYRCLGLKVRFVPTVKANTAAIASYVIIASLSRVPPTNPGSFAAAWAGERPQAHNTCDEFTMEIKPTDLEELTFSPVTANPTNMYGIAYYANTLTTGTNYYIACVECVCQFRAPA